MALDESMLHRVVPSSLPSELGTDTVTASGDTQGAMTNANSTWKGLDAYFSVHGAEGVFQMLERLVVDAEAFSTAVFEGHTHLVQAETTFSSLERRRTNLVTDIEDVNADLASARSTLNYQQRQSNMVCYEAGSYAEWEQLNDMWNAQRDMQVAERAEEKLRTKIERFNESVENAERDLARNLSNVNGGTDVHGVSGAPIRSQMWGNWGSTGASMSDLPMVQRFERALTTQYITRYEWMLEQDPSTITTWLDAHPGFVAGAAMVDPTRISSWFNRHVPADSVTSDWQPEGAWAKLKEHAPGAIGNLNGIPSIVRDNYNRAYLDDLLDQAYADPDKYSKQIERLEAIERQIVDRYGNAKPDTYLLTVYLGNNESLLIDDFGERMGMVFGGDAELEPRAAIAFGNPDLADLTITMTHGIRTDSNNLDAWRGHALNLQNETLTELDRRGYAPEEGRHAVSTITWFGYDSQGIGAVNSMPHAEAGAASYAQFAQGLEAQNSQGSVHGWFHSYGTTMAAQSLARNDGLIDDGYMLGSAGWSDGAASTLAGQDSISLHASHSDRDWTAPMGRTGISDHSVDPRDVSGVNVIDTEDGTVDFGVGADGQVYTREAYEPGGHATEAHDPWYEWGGEQYGYLSVDSRPFQEGVDLAADELAPTE